ncbi:unnamed protein product [Schistocephalus solidus]|uniref:C2H2-type domain-containing protein n=1 Tax=Schistocephalus solidus TaxID=70667 RepID=A0A3P7C5Q6_SCHSO|nr:unnamed protein product [Schistocephalus solidus]
MVGHLRTQCTNNPKISISTSNFANPPSDSPTLTPGINSITPTIIETTSLYSSSVTPTTAFAFTTTSTTIIDGYSLLNCPQCDRTFTSRISLVGHLRIHRTETGEPVPGAPTHSGDRRLYCPYCPRAFTHRMGLLDRAAVWKLGKEHYQDWEEALTRVASDGRLLVVAAVFRTNSRRLGCASIGGEAVDMREARLGFIMSSAAAAIAATALVGVFLEVRLATSSVKVKEDAATSVLDFGVERLDQEGVVVTDAEVTAPVKI